MSFGIGGGLTPWVQRLIIANVVVFVLQNSVPAINSLIVFVPQYILRQPWTLITYMFAHGSIMHLLFNMLGLFFFGPPLEARWGSGEFLKYYLICGLGGAALSFLFASSPILGASAAVYGVMLAFAMNWPDAPILIWGIFPVPAKILVMIFAAMSLFSAVGGANDGVAHFAHLGGFAAGFIYLKLDHRGGGLFTRVRKMITKRQMNVSSGGGTAAGRDTTPGILRSSHGARGAARSTGTVTGNEAKLLSDLDRILDKISTQGMNSLTGEERRLLDEASRRSRLN